MTQTVKSLSNVIFLRAENDRGYRVDPKVIYVENHLLPDGTVKKHIEVEEDPKYTFYSTHHLIGTDDEISEEGVNYVKKELCRPITVRYADMPKKIAQISGQMDFYNACVRNGRFRDLSNLDKDVNTHLSDMHLADYKIREWLEANRDQKTVVPISKAFFDIEVDIYGYEGFPEPEEAPRPVALVSYLYEPTMVLHSFILRNEDNHSQTEFLEALAEHEEDYVAHLLEEFNASNGNGKTKFKQLTDIKFHIFEDELDLLKAFFKLVKRDKPDFCGAWNASFDMKTMEMRLLNEGVNTTKVMCPAEFPYKQVSIRPDTFNTDFSKKKSQFDVTGYTQFICLLENFASIRATMGKRESYALGDILLEEIGESKYDFEGDITDALYVDFEGFLKYSLYDSFRLYQLEEKNKDIDLLYKMSLMTATRFSKVMTKTVSIRNFAAMVLEDEGFVLSNNHNKHKDHGEKEKFRGAFVALSKLMEPVGIELNGVRSAKVYENVIDEDLASLYPSIILAWNIDADTMVGKVRCEHTPELEDEIPTLLAEADYVKIGNQLLGLPTVSDVLENMEEYLS